MNKLLLLLPLLSVLTTVRAYSQELYTEELLWISRDSIEVIVFQDTDQIIEWSKKQMPFASVMYAKVLTVNDNNIFIVNIVGYSGIIRNAVYIFKISDIGLWHLIMKTQQVVLKEKIIVETNDNEQALLFISGPDVIGKIAYEFF